MYYHVYFNFAPLAHRYYCFRLVLRFTQPSYHQLLILRAWTPKDAPPQVHLDLQLTRYLPATARFWHAFPVIPDPFSLNY